MEKEKCMKATLLKALEDYTRETHGDALWKAALKQSGFGEETVFFPLGDIEDEKVVHMVGVTAAVLGMSMADIFREYGSYWVNVYTPRVYPHYYKGISSMRELLVSLDDIHASVTKMIANAKPPRFTYVWENDTTLVMTYLSHRGLVDLMVEMARALTQRYGDNAVVTKRSSTDIEVVFEP